VYKIDRANLRRADIFKNRLGSFPHAGGEHHWELNSGRGPIWALAGTSRAPPDPVGHGLFGVQRASATAEAFPISASAARTERGNAECELDIRPEGVDGAGVWKTPPTSRAEDRDCLYALPKARANGEVLVTPSSARAKIAKTAEEGETSSSPVAAFGSCFKKRYNPMEFPELPRSSQSSPGAPRAPQELPG